MSSVPAKKEDWRRRELTYCTMELKKVGHHYFYVFTPNPAAPVADSSPISIPFDDGWRWYDFLSDAEKDAEKM